MVGCWASAADGARMKKLFAAIVTLTAFVGAPALGADMPLKAPAAAPPPAFSWTGFYLGGFAGGAGTRSVSNPDATNPGTVGPFPPGTPVTGCNFGAGPGLTPAVSRATA
jgi:outer membrane immunogenic protein